MGQGAGSNISDAEAPLTGPSANEDTTGSGPASVPQPTSSMATSKCIKGCAKATKLHADCSKDVIRQVVDGQDKYFRMCSQICLPRDHPKYVNYDKSGPDLPFNPVLFEI